MVIFFIPPDYCSQSKEITSSINAVLLFLMRRAYFWVHKQELVCCVRICEFNVLTLFYFASWTFDVGHVISDFYTTLVFPTFWTI